MEKLKPLKQGSLESTCGIYSILNAYEILNYGNQNNRQEFFDEIIFYLEKKRLLGGIITGGMAFREMKIVMDNVAYKYIPNYKVIWTSFPNPNTKVFWNSIRSHLEREGNSIIIGTMGKQTHWTTGISCTSKTIKLLDGEWKRIKYSECTTTSLDENKLILYPAQTFFISKEN